MNEDQTEGNLKQLKGKAKEALGKLTGNEKTQAEGTADRVKGKVQETVGDVKGAIDKKVHDSDCKSC